MRQRGYEWLKLIAMLVVCIVGEAMANVTLLTRALSTGLVGAFITAVLVSAINVGALGAGGGLLLSGVRRHSNSGGGASIRLRPVTPVRYDSESHRGTSPRGFRKAYRRKRTSDAAGNRNQPGIGTRTRCGHLVQSGDVGT